jgi:hypothetical protein
MTATAPTIAEQTRVSDERIRELEEAFDTSRQAGVLEHWSACVIEECDDTVAALRELLRLRTALRDAKPALESAMQSLLVEATRFEERARRQKNKVDLGLAAIVNGHIATLRALVGRIEG